MEGMKFLLFFVVVACISLAGLKAYLYFNQKIIGSSTFGRLMLYTVLLIVINIVIVLGGLLILFTLYRLLADV